MFPEKIKRKRMTLRSIDILVLPVLLKSWRYGAGELSALSSDPMQNSMVINMAIPRPTLRR
jgi:hypothetical protein